MTAEKTENIEIATVEYQAGRVAFERGSYRESVTHLEKASALTLQNTRLGGEIRLWLVTAYEANGQRNQALELCRQLRHHPHWEVRKQGRRVLYILEAPQLSTRPEWLTQIPDLSQISEDRKVSPYTNSSYPTPKKPPQEPKKVEFKLTEANEAGMKDNAFIWVALILLVTILFGFIWWG